MFFSAYLHTLDEELLALFTYISTHEPLASAALKVEELKDGSQLGEGQTQSGVGKRDFIVRNHSLDVLAEQVVDVRLNIT